MKISVFERVKYFLDTPFVNVLKKTCKKNVYVLEL